MIFRRQTGPSGFTLVEVLVVVAVVAMLIAILLPALSRARDAARQSMSAERLKQFGVANAAHESDTEEPAMFPVLFERGTNLPVMRGDRPADVDLSGTLHHYRGFGAVGMTMHPVQKGTKSQLLHEGHRQLNWYLDLPGLEPTRGRHPADLIDDDPDLRAERAVFRSPWRENPIKPDPRTDDPQRFLSFGLGGSSTAYDLLGTSYLANTLWLDAEIAGTSVAELRSSTQTVDEVYRFADAVVPKIIYTWPLSRTVFMAEAQFILTLHQGGLQTQSGEPVSDKAYQLLFLDGHVGSHAIEAEDVNTIRSGGTFGNPFWRQLVYQAADAAPCNSASGDWLLFPEFRDDEQLAAWCGR